MKQNNQEKKDLFIKKNEDDLIEKLDLNLEIEDYSKILEKNKKSLQKKLSKLKKINKGEI